MGGQVIHGECQFVASLRPHEFEVQDTVGRISVRPTCALIVLVDDVRTHALLPAERPRGGEAAYDAVVYGGGELMTQVLHGVVALVYLRVVLAVLVYVGISQFHCRHDARGHPLLREEGDGDGVATVVQAEVGGVVRVVSGVHHPVYHVRPPVVEASEASLNACGAILRSKSQGVCLLGFEVFVALLRG